MQGGLGGRGVGQLAVLLRVVQHLEKTSDVRLEITVHSGVFGTSFGGDQVRQVRGRVDEIDQRGQVRDDLSPERSRWMPVSRTRNV